MSSIPVPTLSAVAPSPALQRVLATADALLPAAAALLITVLLFSAAVAQVSLQEPSGA